MAEFADARAIIAETLDALLPPQRDSIANFAETHRWLSNAGGGAVGKFTHDIVPYIREPQEVLTDPAYHAVAVAGPGQSAKTTIAENWLMYSIGSGDPGSILWYMQNDDAIEAYAKETINPLIDHHQILRERQGLRAVDDSLHFKRFRGMSLQMLAATDANLVSKKAPRIVCDEVDIWLRNLSTWFDKVDIRRQTFGSASKVLALSHPDAAEGLDERNWNAGIMQLYRASDQRRWYWPCPHCNGFSSPNPGAAREMALFYPDGAPLDEIAEAARLQCPCCGTGIADSARIGMNRDGLWVARGETIDMAGRVSGMPKRTGIAGFWITGAMSPFIRGGIGELARARAAAERDAEISGDVKPLRDVMAKKWGIPYAPPKSARTVDAAAIRDRALGETARLGYVADGVRVLTASVDINATWFEILVRGWGVEGESWIVDHFKIFSGPKADRPVNPAVYSEDWDLLLPRVIERAYPMASDPARLLRLRAIAIDTGGAAGVTDQAYDAWRRWRRARIVRPFGQTQGRDLWNVLLVKGSSMPNPPRLRVGYPDSQRRDRLGGLRGDIPLGEFAPNPFKDSVTFQLQRTDAGKDYIHFPASLLPPKPLHGDFFDQLCAEERDRLGRWTKKSPAWRNEALDLMVMSHAAAYCWGVHRIDWTRPPAWALDPRDGRNPLALSSAPVSTAMGAPASAPILPPAVQIQLSEAPQSQPQRKPLWERLPH